MADDKEKVNDEEEPEVTTSDVPTDAPAPDPGSTEGPGK